MDRKQWITKNKIPSMDQLIQKTLEYIKYKNWYKQSNELIKHYYPKDYNTFIDLLAITSPRNTVKFNCLWSIQTLDNIKYNRENNIVYGIANKLIQNNLKMYLKIKKYGGIKINAFARSLRLINNSVCIDVWVMKAFNLKRVAPTSNDIIHITAIIKEIATRLNLKTYEVQACLWVYAKNELNGTKFKEYKDFAYYLKSYFNQTKLEVFYDIQQI